jgi:imidazolonepropionase-like amidohydrolase
MISLMRKIFLATTVAFCFTAAIIAQPVDDELPQITGCIALVNANVVTAPGKSPMVTSIVMKDGLITQIGQELRIPAEAYRIAADSLYVYPAFIDAFSYTGIKEPENEGGGNQQGPGNRGGAKPSFDAEGNLPLEDAGITPYKNVRTTFDAKDKSIADWRAQGFAIAHVVPRGKMLPGKGSVVVLSGKESDQVLWKEDISMYGQWTGTNGYPSTVIGVMAKWRELYQNATQAMAHQASYENVSLVSRPVYNQAHEALIPVVKKEMPVYFRATHVKDISRALELQKDLGMKMVIANAEEAWYLKDKFKSGDVSLVLSLKLPEDKSQPKEDGKGKEDSKPADKSVQKDSLSMDTLKTQSMDTVIIDPEQADFEKKRAQSLKEHREQAALMARESIPFSFGTINVKPGDFSKNLSLMLENGLSADHALKALTTQPASLLGISKYCGTIEVGKMANLIVSTKPLFEKEAAIRYMIVEGNLYAYETKDKKKPSAKPSSDHRATGPLIGKWAFEVEFEGQTEKGEFDFADHQGEITGTISGENITSGHNELENIVLEGNQVSFTYDMDMGGQMIEFSFDLKLDGDTFDGKVNMNLADTGSFPITGKRISKPQH